MANSAYSSIDPLILSKNSGAPLLPTQASACPVQVLEQPVEFVQSLELVQTMICAVISTIASLRCLFPEDCFRVHRYNIESPSYSYKDFMNTSSGESNTTTNPRLKVDHRYVPWDILVRGTNGGVNKLLDWIELGVADALSRKYLKTLQLSIYDGEISPLKRVEAYIMVFSYTECGVDMQLQLLCARGLPLPPEKTISNVKQELRYLVHRLATHIGGFPELSPRSIVNMHFTYNDSCPVEYQPPGFVMCQDHGLILQNNEGALVGTLHPGPHRVDLRVFVKEQEIELVDSPNLPTTAILRGSTVDMRKSRLMEVNDSQPAVMQDMKQEKEVGNLATLHPTQEQNGQASNISHITSALDTQERAQLAAIDSMARLRAAHNDPHDTQILDMTTSGGHIRHGSIDLDVESTVVDGSSTQGTPSTVGSRRSARLSALKSAAKSPPSNTLATLQSRKRQPRFEKEERTPKLVKVSKARSPFSSSGFF